jgi:hypothetical protein
MLYFPGGRVLIWTAFLTTSPLGNKEINLLLGVNGNVVGIKATLEPFRLNARGLKY